MVEALSPVSSLCPHRVVINVNSIDSMADLTRKSQLEKAPGCPKDRAAHQTAANQTVRAPGYERDESRDFKGSILTEKGSDNASLSR